MIDSDRWQRVGDLFDQALALPADEQQAFLKEACGSDAGLMAEVLSLLKHSAGEDSLLDGVATDALDVLRSIDDGGNRLGPYLLIRRIGQGGMGEVYLAERADGQYEQQVAVKVVRSGLVTERVKARFLRERQILARLQHPSISRLLDGGITEEGRPYFVMEYVDGTPIDVYADEHRLSVEERLRLFSQICNAVTYAHANLVVHRDLKPSNILVTDAGDVKLLDFGIAKLMHEDAHPADASPDHLPITQTGFSAMTPAYASPEQARGEPVGTSTDIYSLGVVLYELLTGVRPYEVSGQMPLEAVRVICQVDPERPSTVVSQVKKKADTISLSRGTHPGRLRRLLAGDLDVICLKALRKEPPRRYRTADEMGDDIDRHLRGRPIEARADSAMYRAGKYLRRNQMAVAIAGTLLLTSAILISIYTMRLQVALEEAEGAATFLTEVFEEADVARQGMDVTVIEAATVAAATVSERYQDNPALRARIQLTLGNIFRNTRENDRISEQFRAALASSEEAFGKSDVRTREARFRFIESKLGPDEDRDLVDSLFADGLKYEPVVPDFWTLSILRGQSAEFRGEFDEAEQLFRQSITDLAARPGPEAMSRKLRLANLLSDQDRFEEAIPLYNEVINTAEVSGTPQATINWYRMELAYAYAESGQDSLGVVTYEQLLPSAIEINGTEHIITYLTKSNMAQLYGRLGMHEKARMYSLDALETKMRMLGESNPSTLIGMVYYGEILARTNLDEARPYFEKAIALGDEVWPDGDWRLGEFRELYAVAFSTHGKSEDALHYALEAWAQYERTPEPSPNKPTEMAQLIAGLYGDLGMEEQASAWQVRHTASLDSK